MAESDGPSMPPQKKPKRESHFDSSWINDFSRDWNLMIFIVGVVDLISGCGASLI